MRFGIFTNLSKDVNALTTKKAISTLNKLLSEVYLCKELESLNLGEKCLSNAELARVCDVVVVFGGDGTILRIAKECAEYDAKIFAVNLGRLGFLTEIENVDLEQIFADIINNNYYLDERTLITAHNGEKEYIALNEVVLARSSSTKMIKYNVFVNDHRVDTYYADGIIVATPTGSTAYSLSTGGPILSPDVEGLIITPICPHSLQSRPIVVSSNSHITLQLLRADSFAYLNIDGEDVAKVEDNQVIEIEKAYNKVNFIRVSEYNFFDRLITKMNYWCNNRF